MGILSILGTLISAFAVFCCGKHAYEKNIVACLYNLLAAILQSATIFLLVGWIWSVRWGILFVQLSGKSNRSIGNRDLYAVTNIVVGRSNKNNVRDIVHRRK